MNQRDSDPSTGASSQAISTNLHLPQWKPPLLALPREDTDSSLIPSSSGATLNVLEGCYALKLLVSLEGSPRLLFRLNKHKPFHLSPGGHAFQASEHP